MHVVSCTTVLDPDSANPWNGGVDRCFAAVRKSAEYSSVCRTVVRIAVSTTVVATSTTVTIASPSTASRFLIVIAIAIGMLSIVFFRNPFATIQFDVIPKTTIVAAECI